MDRARPSQSPPRTAGLATRPAARGGRRPLAIASTLAVIVAGSFTPPGSVAVAWSFSFLEYFTGVFSLVGLSVTVMIGLAATDRLLLLVRHRILLQVAHRATAATAVVCLAIHILTKCIEGHAHVWDMVVPFLAGHRPVQVGLGTLASYLMIMATWTGATRASYAQSRRPGRWRALHATAYGSWLLAMVHGLGAGRAAKPWVAASYTVCVALVVLALLVRLFVALSRRTHLARAHTLRKMRPTGQPTPIAATTPLATNVLIPTLAEPEWADVEPDGPARRRAVDVPGPAAPRPATVPPVPVPDEVPSASRASDYRPYRPLREDRPASPPYADTGAAGRHSDEPTRPEPPTGPQRPRTTPPRQHDAATRPLDETAEITDEQFWAYIRNEVGR
ncbi:hypothetical protein OG799_19070 [Micromonospora sp. NBC_00898]|uniref:hypothetical protein n=1 Tax=Micromonospora sp. NBC_00898 TaxID=2975981 RepID=UPI00386E5EE8|nr:hypothetical protein OG799_19070 [Micromonospora sp. NBC_00898]